MNVHCHFAVVGLSNTYLIGPEDGGDAIIIDPSRFDIPLLNMIEDRGYYIRSILVTHGHENHVRGVSTIMKIYDATIYSAAGEIMGFPTETLYNGIPLELGGIKVEPMEIRGHSSDSLVFKIGKNLFTGDILSAGRIGTTDSNWSKANLIKDLQDKIMSQPPETQIFPGHGPPSTLKIEKIANSDLLETQEK